jgi:hypothetical protein
LISVRRSIWRARSREGVLATAAPPADDAFALALTRLVVHRQSHEFNCMANYIPSRRVTQITAATAESCCGQAMRRDTATVGAML